MRQELGGSLENVIEVRKTAVFKRKQRFLVRVAKLVCIFFRLGRKKIEVPLRRDAAGNARPRRI